MDALGNGHTALQKGVMTVVDALRNSLGLSVFYAGEERPVPSRFEDEAWALRDNCDILERTARFVMIYPGPPPGQRHPRASSALIEIGYALALRVPLLIYYQQSTDTLPFLLRAAPAALEQCLLVRYRDMSDIVESITSRNRDFFPTDDARAV
jgi:hypothetical protein